MLCAFLSSFCLASLILRLLPLCQSSVASSKASPLNALCLRFLLMLFFLPLSKLRRRDPRLSVLVLPPPPFFPAGLLVPPHMGFKSRGPPPRFFPPAAALYTIFTRPCAVHRGHLCPLKVAHYMYPRAVTRPINLSWGLRPRLTRPI